MSSLPNSRVRLLPVTILTLLALVFLFGSVRSQDKPVWRFSILASIDEVFVEQFGGMDMCDSLIRFQLDSINHIYNDPDVFDGVFDFYLDSLQSFSGSGLTQAKLPHPDQDYHIVYYFDRMSLYNWMYPPANAVLFRTYSTSEIPFPFFTPGHLVLAHELAHSRGAIDLYGLEVMGSFNWVNGKGFSMPNSYMNDLMSQVWDEYTRLLVNRNGGDVLPAARFRLAMFPDRMIIRATDDRQGPLPGASVRIYGHPWYNMTLTDDIIDESTTDEFGEYILSGDLFVGSDSLGFCANALCIRFPTLLVEIEYDGSLGYLWLPFTDPQTYLLEGNTAPFIRTVEVSRGQVGPSLPEDFTLDQNFPNPFNSRTSICVTLPTQGRLRLEIANILGQTEAVIYDGSAPEGTSCYAWDGDASSGVYLCRATYSGIDHAVKMLLLK